MCILAYFYKFKVPNTPSVENYDNTFLFFENLISKWTLATETFTPSRDPRGIYIPSNKGTENFSHYQTPCSYLRNENSGDFALFKNHLDIFLSSIPDQPTTPGLLRAASSNSLLDQVPLCS